MLRLIVGFALALVAQTLAFAQAQSFSGAGSSAAAPIYKSWAREYRKSSGVTLVYESIGSSAGVKKIAAHESDFGASDVAPPEAELAKLGLTAFPIAITAITPIQIPFICLACKTSPLMSISARWRWRGCNPDWIYCCTPVKRGFYCRRVLPLSCKAYRSKTSKPTSRPVMPYKN